LQDLIFIKSLEANTLQLSSTNKLELKLNDTGAIKNNSNGLYVKLKSGLKSDIDGLYIDFDSTTLELGTNNELQLKLSNTGSISKNTNGLYIKLKEINNINKSGLKSDVDGLYINFDTNTLELDTNNKLKVNLKSGGGISQDSNGIYQTYEIAGIDPQTLEISASKILSIKGKTITSASYNSATNRTTFYYTDGTSDTTGVLKGEKGDQGERGC